MKKLKKFLLKFCLIFVLLNVGIFVIFFFDLDGKLLFNVVEPFLKKHYDNMERFNCDMVAMYDQLQCKGMQGVHGLFEDEFRKRNVNAFWMPHALPDCRTVSRAEIRRQINDYMTTVMHEEPLDPSLLDFDDSMTW